MNIPRDEFYGVEDIMSLLGIGKSKAYDIMKQFNRELEDIGYYTVAGRVSKSYFDSRMIYRPERKPPRR